MIEAKSRFNGPGVRSHMGHQTWASKPAQANEGVEPGLLFFSIPSPALFVSQLTPFTYADRDPHFAARG